MEVIYEDEYIVVVNKPFGMPVQKDLTEDTDVSSFLNEKYGEIYMINRIDRPVGGLVLFGKDKTSACALSKQIEGRAIEKKYLAVAKGRTEEKKEIKSYLLKNGRLNISKTVNKNTKNAKEAILNYRLLAYSSALDMSLLEISLETGRHHQIRVQMAGEGNYLIGDTKYGKKDYKYRNVALYSYYMKFNHPKTKELLEIRAPYPKEEPFSSFSISPDEVNA